MNDSQLKTKIMRRVRFIYWSKRVYHSVTLKIFLLGVFGASATLYVSLPHVLKNMPSLSDFAAVWKFFAAAFANTAAPVQLLLLAALAVLVWLAYDVIQSSRDSELLMRGRVGA